ELEATAFPCLLSSPAEQRRGGGGSALGYLWLHSEVVHGRLAAKRLAPRCAGEEWRPLGVDGGIERRGSAVCLKPHSPIAEGAAALMRGRPFPVGLRSKAPIVPIKEAEYVGPPRKVRWVIGRSRKQRLGADGSGWDEREAAAGGNVGWRPELAGMAGGWLRLRTDYCSGNGGARCALLGDGLQIGGRDGRGVRLLDKEVVGRDVHSRYERHITALSFDNKEIAAERIVMGD
ncbi:hypothetical protein GW17_00024391, partial [Ensete ventricosum]